MDDIPAGVDTSTPADIAPSDLADRLSKLALDADGGESDVVEDEPEAVEGDESAEDGEKGEATDEEAPEVAELRANVGELEQKVQSLEARDTEWRSSALGTLVQSRGLAEQIAMYEQYLEAAGIVIDPKDLQILELRRAGYSREIEGQVKQKTQTSTSEAAVTARVTELRAEADRAAAEHSLPVDILFARWNHLCEKAGKTVPFAEAAKSVNADLKRGMTQKQVAANSAVKAPLKLKGGGSSSRPTFAPPTTDEGIRQRLKAAGHDIS